MSIVDRFAFRLAGRPDLPWCVQEDHLVSPKVMERLIDQHCVFLAEIDGMPQGCLRLEFLWSTIPYISVVFVQEEYQRQGVGRALLGYVERHLREGGHEILLSSSTVTEPDPQAWHRAVGFQECGMLAGINGDGIGEVFFSKRI